MALNQRLDATSDKLRHQYEGQLCKYTNVMKGWQYRWFVLYPEAGILHYYLNESERKQRPRGSVHLAGAVISPSDEDGNTFTVNSASGEMFKLRATDARARQEWVNRLRTVAEMHTLAIAQSNPPLAPREHLSLVHIPPPAPQAQCSLEVLDAFATVRQHLNKADQSSQLLSTKVEDLPSSGKLKNTDEDLLLLKATSQATVTCLANCLSILEQQQLQPLSSSSHPHSHKKVGPSPSKLPTATFSSYLEKTDDKQELVQAWTSPLPSPLHSPPPSPPVGSKIKALFKVEDEITDDEDFDDIDSDDNEENKSVILHLLSQLKLGMDLTRVVLPTFILERRSLLEMFADCMGHPDCFLKIVDQSTPEDRILAVVEWYLTSFHMGRKSTIAKKPYNPIIGEIFHCSWKINNSSIDNSESSANDTILTYVAEQVSHHPPITAFYVECREKMICLNASIWTKSNFSGMSIGVNMIGEISLYLGMYNEKYTFSLPAAYARSILSIPWVELGGKVNITANTGLNANIIFHTKPFYGGKVNVVTADVRNGENNICKVQGEWNSHFEFSYPNGEQKTIFVNQLPIYKKRVRPLHIQGQFESRRLWSKVTESLQNKDLASATSFKCELEERQRQEERIRQEEGQSYPTVFFHQSNHHWIYNNLLIKL